MAQSTYLSELGIHGAEAVNAPRHSALVRATHWITVICFFSLLVSGTAILLVQPTLYWGETGNFLTPSLIDLPIPYVSRGQSGWGRHLHFMTAWISIVTGLVYVVFGFATGYFRKNLFPSDEHLSWESLAHTFAIHLRPKPLLEIDFLTYNFVQRMTYLAVIFVLFPMMIWTGLAMSLGLTSVFPALVNVLGGHQSARTLHFCVAVLLVAFLIVHVAMVCLSGFARRMGGMITGRHSTRKEPT